MDKSAIKEVEAFNYWTSMRKLNALYRVPVAAPDDIEDAKAELEAMAMHTEWGLLHDRCMDVLETTDIIVSDEDVA